MNLLKTISNRLALAFILMLIAFPLLGYSSFQGSSFLQILPLLLMLTAVTLIVVPFEKYIK